MSSKKKVLVVGGGLAGICLTHQLIKKDLDVKLIDLGENHSSRIAAGMINPMVFRTMVKTWKGDILLPYLQKFYPEIEKTVGVKFFFPRDIRRVFTTEEEKEKWLLRQENPEYENYIEVIGKEDNAPSYVHSINGSGIVKSPGYIDAKLFMEANFRYFLNEGILTIEKFDFLSFIAEQLVYKGQHYDAVIFSEGYKGKENPFFNYLPLQQTKGEVLTIQSDELNKSEILNRKCFVLPTEDGKFRLGATFTWNTTDISPTEEAKKTLIAQYQQLSSAKITIEDQKGGIRPTVTDRRPLIGEHPMYKNIFIFNGLGTKGYMIAPYYSAHFIDFLLNHQLLDPEVDIKRFEKKHFKSVL